MKHTISHIRRGLWVIKNPQAVVVSYARNRPDAVSLRRSFEYNIWPNAGHGRKWHDVRSMEAA